MLKFIFCLLLAELQARASEVPYLRNHPRNFAPQAYQCKIIESTLYRYGNPNATILVVSWSRGLVRYKLSRVALRKRMKCSSKLFWREIA